MKALPLDTHKLTRETGFFCLIVWGQGFSQIIELGRKATDREDSGSIRPVE